MALVARLIGFAVGDEFHLVVFKADTGMDIQSAKGESSTDISSPQCVVSAVVIDLVDIFEQVELVGTVVVGIAQQACHLHRAESAGQAVAFGVVPIHEVAGGVLTGAVLAVGTHLHLWLPVTEDKLMLVVDIGRDDVLVERGPLARDVVLIEPHIVVALAVILVVENVFTTVRQPAIGIRIADAPIKCIATEGMAAGYLTGIGCSATIVIFCRAFGLGLGTEAFTPGVSVVADLVEDVLELVFVLTAGTEQGHVEECAETYVVVVLVVGGEAQWVGAVVFGVVGSIEIVEHVAVDAVLVGIVHGGDGTELSSGQCPAMAPVGSELQVAPGMLVLHCPVVVEVVVREAVHGVTAAVLSEVGQGSVDTAVERAQSVVEAEEVGAALLGGKETLEGRRTVPVAAHRDMKGILQGNLFGIDHDEATCVVGRIFRRRRLHDGEVVDLVAWNHVEREGSLVGLTAGHGTPIHPHIIISLGQATHHNEFVVDEAHTGHAADDFAGIGVLGELDILGRDVAHDDGTVFYFEHGGRDRISSFHTGHRDSFQLLFIRLQCDGENVFCC